MSNIESFSEQVFKLTTDIINNRAAIREDFVKAYLAHLLLENYPLDMIMDRIELVEEHRVGKDGEPSCIVWYFRERTNAQKKKC